MMMLLAAVAVAWQSVHAGRSPPPKTKQLIKMLTPIRNVSTKIKSEFILIIHWLLLVQPQPQPQPSQPPQTAVSSHCTDIEKKHKNRESKSKVCFINHTLSQTQVDI